MTLPTLALRGVSVFPGTVLHFDVERPMSIAALNAAIGTDRMIFLVAQRDIACDTPRADDLYTVGTICRLSQILRAPGGGNVKCIVDGLYRAKLLRLTAETPALWANVRVLADKPVDADTLECTALIRSCNDLFAEYASASGTIGPETLLRVADRKEPGFVSDYIAQNVFLQPAEKQLLLEECSPLQRLTMLCDMLHRELEIMDIQQNLQSTAAERVAKNQKDYFLREQMRVIQEELGEASETDDLDEYRRKILDLGLDAEIEKKLLKELSRLAKQPFGSAEGAVLRTYLDVCLELPWNERTKDVTDIAHAKKVLDEDHYGLTKVKDRILEYLAVRQLSAQVKGGVLCLVGPPGVGKTSIAMSIARATNRKCARISLGGVHDEAEIREYEELVPMFERMRDLAAILRKKRMKRGSIDFDFPETKIILDAQGRPVEIKPYERNVATKIIEDFMLLANETVAQDYFWQELPFVYRTHENPDTEKIHKLATFINNFGYSIHIGQDEVHPKELQKLLLRIDGTPEEALISRLTLRSMKQAKYSTVNTGHFGLATSYYCHFTSPIRRYPDLQIHRIIKDNLRGRMNAKRIEHYEKILPEVAKHSSEMERRADEAERECDKLKKVQYMSGHLGEEFWGVISGVTEWGFYVELPNTVEGLVHVTTLTDDYFHYSESTYELIGETTAKRYKLGQKVKVVVAATDPFMRTIDFRVVTGIEDEENEKLNQKFIAE